MFLFLFLENPAPFLWSSVAFLDKELLALKSRSSQQIDVYNADDYRTYCGLITIPLDAYASFVDMAACCFYRCLYLADANNTCIVRLKLPSELSKWKVDDIGYDAVISVTSSHDLLVMCDKSNRVEVIQYRRSAACDGRSSARHCQCDLGRGVNTRSLSGDSW